VPDSKTVAVVRTSRNPLSKYLDVEIL